MKARGWNMLVWPGYTMRENNNCLRVFFYNIWSPTARRSVLFSWTASAWRSMQLRRVQGGAKWLAVSSRSSGWQIKLKRIKKRATLLCLCPRYYFTKVAHQIYRHCPEQSPSFPRFQCNTSFVYLLRSLKWDNDINAAISKMEKFLSSLLFLEKLYKWRSCLRFLWQKRAIGNFGVNSMCKKCYDAVHIWKHGCVTGEIHVWRSWYYDQSERCHAVVTPGKFSSHCSTNGL